MRETEIIDLESMPIEIRRLREKEFSHLKRKEENKLREERERKLSRINGGTKPYEERYTLFKLNK